jgi:hypothetical protein
MEKKSPFTMFINPVIVKQLPNGPKITACAQVIIYKNKEEKWDTDTVAIVEIESIDFMGVVTDNKDYKILKNIIDTFKSMGIDLYKIMQQELENMVSLSDDAKVFVIEHTGIILPE